MSMSLTTQVLTKYMSDAFVETGTAVGGGVHIALSCKFPSIYSIELSKQLQDLNIEKFKAYPNVNLFTGDSELLLNEVVTPIKGRITFFLDSHIMEIGERPVGKHEIPLIEELDIIKRLDRNDHTIMIDDRRMFGHKFNGEYGFKEWEDITERKITEKLREINPQYVIYYEPSNNAANDIMVACLPQYRWELSIDKAKEIKGWMSDAELIWLGNMAHQSKRILEVGSWLGRSTRSICDNALGTVDAVDSWEGPSEPDIRNEHFKEAVEFGSNYPFKIFSINLQEHLDSGILTTYKMDSGDAAKELERLGRQEYYDMIFLDADHTYELTKRDMINFRPFLKKGGLFCGHDQWFPGVNKAIKELLAGYDVVDSIWHTRS